MSSGKDTGMSYCVKCAIEFDDNKKFCKFCGSKLKLNQHDNQRISPENISSALDPAAASEACILSSDIDSTNIEKQLDNSIIPTDKLNEAEHDSAEPQNLHKVKKVEISQPVQPSVQPIKQKPIPPDKSSVSSVAGILLTIVVSFLMIAGGFWGYVRFAEDKSQPLESARASNSPILNTSQQQKKVAGLSKSPKEEVNQVFENLKKANLTKNIDLFLSCYSLKFSSLKNKKSATLASWEQYDYKTLKYHIKDQSFYDDKASGIVEWSITAYSHKTGKLVSMDMAFNVGMQKEDGIFKIVSLEKSQ